jgi:hypothetical protein
MTATAGPERDGSAFGVPVPRRTIFDGEGFIRSTRSSTQLLGAKLNGRVV